MRRIWIVLGCIFSFCTAHRVTTYQQDDIPVKGYKLTWSDEFNGNALNRSKWNHRGLKQKRGEAFVDDKTVNLDGNGNVVLEAKLVNGTILAGMIATEGIFETKYGYFECRASFTKMNGVFPSFWLQSKNNGEHGNPETNGVELDVFEYFHHARQGAVAHTLHYGGYGATHKVAGPVWGTLKSTRDDFHVFGLEWTPSSYRVFVDGVETYKGNTLISKVPEFMVLSIGVDKQTAGPVNTKELPAKFVVDYVRVYKKVKE